MVKTFLLPRFPTKSEMALSSQVKECVTQASSHLREGLAFAARTEHPTVISMLTDVLVRLESVESMEDIMKKFGHQHDIPNSLDQV
mgnify:CR=1 FL=1